MTKPALWTRLQTDWAALSHYQRFTLALSIAYWLMRERDDRLGDASLKRAQ